MNMCHILHLYVYHASKFAKRLIQHLCYLNFNNIINSDQTIVYDGGRDGVSILQQTESVNRLNIGTLFI